MVSPASAKASHTDFVGLYFPAGMPGTDTECPYTWVDPAFCVIDPGTWTELDSGRVRIRGMEVYELAFAWDAEDTTLVEPRKTGYDVVTAHADLDESLSGPTWGTWRLHDLDDELMFTGTFTGAFEEGIPAVHFHGQGVGPYVGQHMSGDIGRVPDPYNMVGRILEV
jgi:hypothetical protein